MKRRNLIIVCMLVMTLLLTSCTPSKQKTKETKNHLTVYLWDNNMIKDVVPYIKEQLPDHAFISPEQFRLILEILSDGIVHDCTSSQVPL